MIFVIFFLLNYVFETPSESSNSSGPHYVRSGLNHTVNIFLPHYKEILRELRITYVLCENFKKMCLEELKKIKKEIEKEMNHRVRKSLIEKKETLKEIIRIHNENLYYVWHFRKTFHTVRTFMKKLKGKKVTEARYEFPQQFGFNYFHSQLEEIQEFNLLWDMIPITDYLFQFDDDIKNSAKELYENYAKVYRSVNDTNIITKSEYKYLENWYKGRLMEESSLCKIF